MIEILNICLHQHWIFIKFFKIFKIHEIFCENPRIIFVLFYDVQKENMFTINLEDRCEAPSNASCKYWNIFSRDKPRVFPNLLMGGGYYKTPICTALLGKSWLRACQYVFTVWILAS